MLVLLHAAGKEYRMRKFGMNSSIASENSVIASLAKQSLLVLILSIVLTACGDDSGTSANDDDSSSSGEKVILSSSDNSTKSSTGSSKGKSSSSSVKALSSSVKKQSSSSIAQNRGTSSGKNSVDGSSSSKKTVSSSSSKKIASSSSTPRNDKESSSSSIKNQSSGSLSSKSDWIWDVSVESLLNPKIKYGSMTDSRDGQTYKTVKIGNQVWMAQNLNYADSNKTEGLKGNIKCYDNNEDHCKVAGRLYTWAAAMDSLGLFNKYGQGCGNGAWCWPIYPVQGVCPDGWHLPSETEWKTLRTAVSGGGDLYDSLLISLVGWEKNNGTDVVGFSALPAGFYNSEKKKFDGVGERAHFWSASEYSYDASIARVKPKDNAYNMYLGSTHMKSSGWASLTDGLKANFYSVRCVEDSQVPDSTYVPYDHSKPLSDRFSYSQFTDPRNGRSYYYYTATSDRTGKSITVMAENLNIGEMVYGAKDQNDDSKIERYCYANDSTNCDEFGGLYQWAEMMQLPSRCNYESCADLIQPNHQGICPDGWRLFTWDDYFTVRWYKDEFNDGIKGLRSSYGFNGSNWSGFSLTGAGYRGGVGGFYEMRESVSWFFPEENENRDDGMFAYRGYISSSTETAPSRNSSNLKKFGYSVRCVKLE